jgi:hypothetical protein
MLWLWIVIATCFIQSTSEAKEMVVKKALVLEMDQNRRSKNDRGPTVYNVKITAKDSTLWIEGKDYDYEWLTIFKYTQIDSMTYRRYKVRRENTFGEDPFSTHKGWAESALMDERGWLKIHFQARKKLRSVILSPPKGEDGALRCLVEQRSGVKTRMIGIGKEESRSLEYREELENRSGLTIKFESDDPKTVERDEHEMPEAVGPPGDGKNGRWLLEDLMSVSDFRKTGIGKLSSDEIQNLEEWIDRHFKRRELSAPPESQ